MKNKGFTLIELLAVIVILAIIALIATPIILNIINETREESNQRSIELYARAVSQAVARYQLNHPNSSLIYGEFTMNEDGKTLITQEGEKLEIEYDGPTINCTTVLIDEKNGTVSLDNCKVNGTGNYNYGIDTICTRSEEEYSYEQSGWDYDENGVIYSTTEIIKDKTDVITCGSEIFYVIKEDEKMITMLSKYNLSTTVFPYKQSATNSGIISWFETSDEVPYWPSNNENIYDSMENPVKSIVKTYEKYLINDLGLITVSTRLLSRFEYYNELCVNELCENYPPWVHSTDYWLGTIYSNGYICDDTYCDVEAIKDGNLYYYPLIDAEHVALGIRPVVIISTSQVK